MSRFIDQGTTKESVYEASWQARADRYSLSLRGVLEDKGILVIVDIFMTIVIGRYIVTLYVG